MNELQIKKIDLQSKINTNIPIRLATLDHFNLRTRFDFTLQENQTGLYSKNHELINIDSCAILHPELEKSFQYFRKLLTNHNPQIKKGSVRLRTSSDLKKWGIWLDFSNLDIKRLLEEKDFLMQLSEKYIVEIGQKKKRLDFHSFSLDRLKLTDPEPENWFKTLDMELLCSVSSFTQPSWETADLLTQEILKWSRSLKLHRIVEYGSGIGQYSLPLLNEGYKLDIIETDLTAIEYLKLNTQIFSNYLSLNDSPKIISNSENTLGLVNPPRSGLGMFIQNILDSRLSYLIYISCFPESLSKDLKSLELKYQIQDILLVDQFARTRHYETALLLQRI